MKKLLIGLSLFCAAAAPVFATDISEIAVNMPPGTWHELPNTRMRAVFPPRAGHPGWGVEGPNAIVSDWGGAAFDTTRNRFIITGGGHRAYGGNEVYEFWLSDLKWHRVTDPSPYVQDPAHPGNDTYVLTTDGSPVSSHTYDGLDYLPGVDKFFQFGGSQWKSGNNTDWHAHLFDLDSNTWIKGARAPTYSMQVASAWDSKRHRELVVNKTGLMAYDPAKDTWSRVTNGWFYQMGRVAAYDPGQDRLFMIGDGKNKRPFAYVDLTTNKIHTAPITGADVPDWRVGLAYDTATKLFVVWNGYGTVWTIDPKTWEAKKLTAPNGPTPSRKDANGKPVNAGTFSHWQYVPDYDVFIAYNSANANVWLYKAPLDNGGSTGDCDADLCVGADYEFKEPSDAAKVAKEGDTVGIEAGKYVDCTVWPVSVSIRGFGGRPVIGDKVCGNKAVWITRGAKTSIENVKLEGALGGTSNAAAIRHEGKALIVRNVEIYNNHNGILVGHDPQMSVEVYDSVFHHMHTRGDLAHNIYVGKIGRFIVKGNYFYDGQSGHFIKTLAAHSTIAYNRIISPEVINAAQIDIWGCSKFEVVGNSMLRAGRYGALAFIQLTKRVTNGRTVACPASRELGGLIAYNTAFFDNNLHDDPRWATLLHYNYPTPNVLIADNWVVHTRDVVTDSTGHFTDNGGRTLGNYHVRKWDPSFFVDPDSGDLRPANKLPVQATPIDFVPTQEPSMPVGVNPRTDSHQVGAYGQ